TKIEVEPEKPQQTSGDVAVAPDQIEIILLAKLLRIRRFVSDPPQTRDAPSFLINRNDRLDLAQVAQVVDEISKLRGAFEIASKENKCSWLDAPKQARCFRIKFFAGHTGHDELTKGIALHGAQR